MIVVIGLIMMVLAIAIYNIDPLDERGYTIPVVRVLLFGGSAVTVIGAIKLFF